MLQLQSERNPRTFSFKLQIIWHRTSKTRKGNKGNFYKNNCHKFNITIYDPLGECDLLWKSLFWQQEKEFKMKKKKKKEKKLWPIFFCLIFFLYLFFHFILFQFLLFFCLNILVYFWIYLPWRLFVHIGKICASYTTDLSLGRVPSCKLIQML